MHDVMKYLSSIFVHNCSIFLSEWSINLPLEPKTGIFCIQECMFAEYDGYNTSIAIALLVTK